MFSPQIPFDGLLTNRLLVGLPGADFARLLPHLEAILVMANQDIYQSGDEIEFVYFPETAVFSHLYYLRDGSATSPVIVGNEGMVGLSAVLDSSIAGYWTQATIAGTAIRVSTEVVKDEFARGNALQQLLLSYTNTRLAQVSLRAVCNGRHRLDERLCTWLLMMDDRTRNHELPLTHETIALHLGARRAGVTVSCSLLRDNGVIDYQRGHILIRDRKMLEEAACECYRMLKKQ